jgi:hypothetical protein
VYRCRCVGSRLFRTCLTVTLTSSHRLHATQFRAAFGDAPPPSSPSHADVPMSASDVDMAAPASPFMSPSRVVEAWSVAVEDADKGTPVPVSTPMSVMVSVEDVKAVQSPQREAAVVATEVKSVVHVSSPAPSAPAPPPPEQGERAVGVYSGGEGEWKSVCVCV